VPYFDLSIKGHVPDSTRAQLTERVAREEGRREHDRLLGTDRAVPYFELSLPGSVRVDQAPSS